jgi:hypothetical protein
MELRIRPDMIDSYISFIEKSLDVVKLKSIDENIFEVLPSNYKNHTIFQGEMVDGIPVIVVYVDILPTNGCKIDLKIVGWYKNSSFDELEIPISLEIRDNIFPITDFYCNSD